MRAGARRSMEQWRCQITPGVWARWVRRFQKWSSANAAAAPARRSNVRDGAVRTGTAARPGRILINAPVRASPVRIVQARAVWSARRYPIDGTFFAPGTDESVSGIGLRTRCSSRCSRAPTVLNCIDTHSTGSGRIVQTAAFGFQNESKRPRKAAVHPRRLGCGLR